MAIETKYKKVYASGKRKTAVARAIVSEGTGNISYKGQNYENLDLFNRLKLAEPVRIAEQILKEIKFDAKISVRGGGEKGQIDASRLALAKAIIDFTKSEELKEAYVKYDRSLLVADIRRKEAYKPGDSKARAKRQSSKR
jgi:small subunit ribosomal protein S9